MRLNQIKKVFIATILGAITACNMNSAGEASIGNSVGSSGSMASMAIVNNSLYIIENQKVRLFDISSPLNPSFVRDVPVGFGVETIFPYQDKLFFGTQTGMVIFDNRQPNNPKYLSTYSHVTACDPVVVQGRFAYVTLRDGAVCRRSPNQLEVIDVQDPRNPKLLQVYPMVNPHGLGIKDTTLFVCDGQNGMKVWDIDTTKQFHVLKEVKQLQGFDGYDVIPQRNLLMLIGKDGLYQFNIADPNNIQQVSVMKIGE
jgi:hypothetical protein